MLNYYLPVINVFTESNISYSERVATSEYEMLYDENTSKAKTMIPHLVLETVVSQFGSTQYLMEQLKSLENEKNKWLIVSFNPMYLRIELNTDRSYSSTIKNICLVIKSSEDFSTIDWDVVRNRYNQIIKLQ